MYENVRKFKLLKLATKNNDEAAMISSEDRTVFVFTESVYQRDLYWILFKYDLWLQETKSRHK